MNNFLRPAWWKQVFDFGWGLGLHRIKLNYIRTVKRQLRRPVCWIRSHIPYDSSSWGYKATKCSRCSKLLEYKSYR